MESFLEQTAEFIKSKFDGKYHEICIVLPGKRGRIFLKENLRKIKEGPLLLPTIIAAEEFMQEVSGLSSIDQLSLNLELYTAWKEVTKKHRANHESESLHEFLKWSNTVIYDFNEIDRSLADPDSVFKNLSDIKHIENWSLGREELTEFQIRYLQFMDSLGDLYHLLRQRLLKKGVGWQGLISRRATERTENSEWISRFSTFIICGFNALNACESKLFYHLQTKGKAVFLWDADLYYLEDTKQEAGEFLRKNFNAIGLKSEGFISNNLIHDKKNIELIAAAGSMSQALITSEKLASAASADPEYNSTAVILADENLLLPVISTLPDSVKKANITLEYPLKLTAVYDLMSLLMQWQSKAEEENKKTISIYYKDFFRFFHNTCIRNIIGKKSHHAWREIMDKITGFNMVFIPPSWLLKHWPEIFEPLLFLFNRWVSVSAALDSLNLLNLTLTNALLEKSALSDADKLELEYVYGFRNALNEIKNKTDEYDCITDIASLFQLTKEVIGNLSVSFIGEPLTGLQIMGVLESRTLDFENVILVGMNEGKLPSGNASGSFIPNDLKHYFGLPLIKEKDAVFAYHFYRLMQRAKNIYLIYNTETDRFGSGEKSRFLTQLEAEFKALNKNSVIKEFVATTRLPVSGNNLISIPKNNDTVELIIDKFSNGFGLSASSVNSYRTCELKFWYNYVAGIKETEELEEGMEAGTFGSILHKCLECIFKPLSGKAISKEDLNLSERNVNDIVLKVFQQFFPEEETPKGKNLIATNILSMNIERQLREDSKLIDQLKKTGEQLRMIGAEEELTGNFCMKFNGCETTFKLSGRIDRIDFCGPLLRIIDYKSSINKDHDNFTFTDMESLFTGKKNSKMIQLFIYAWLAWKNNLCASENINPCIIPFKNFKGEPVQLTDTKKNRLIFSPELLTDFENEIKNLLYSVLNTKIPFSQTTDHKNCEYCTYRSICNR